MSKFETRYATKDEVHQEIQNLMFRSPYESCATCWFFQHTDEMIVKALTITDPPTPIMVMHGLCRRSAPTPTLDLEGDGRAAWPIVDYKRDWCGEYQKGVSSYSLAERFTHKSN